MPVWNPLNRHFSYAWPCPDPVTCSPKCLVRCRMNPLPSRAASLAEAGEGLHAPIPPWYLGNHSDQVGLGLLVVQGGPRPEVQHAAVAVHGELGGRHVL